MSWPWNSEAAAPIARHAIRGIIRCRSRKFNPAGFARWGRISASSGAMFAIIHLLATFIADLFKSPRRLEVENLFLRHQLNVALRRAPQRVRLRAGDRVLMVWMTRRWPSLLGLTRVV